MWVWGKNTENHFSCKGFVPHLCLHSLEKAHPLYPQWQLLPGEGTFRKEPVHIQTTSTDCIWKYTFQTKQLDCSLKSSDCKHLSLCSQQKREKERRVAFFSPLCHHLFLLVCLLHRDFAMIGFFDMCFYCFSFERRRWLKIKWIVH